MKIYVLQATIGNIQKKYLGAISSEDIEWLISSKYNSLNVAMTTAKVKDIDRTTFSSSNMVVFCNLCFQFVK